MNSIYDKCPFCGYSLDENSSSLICMNCGHSLTPEKHFDEIDSKEIEEKTEISTNIFISLGALWWILLIIGGIVSSVVSLVLLFEIV